MIDPSIFQIVLVMRWKTLFAIFELDFRLPCWLGGAERVRRGCGGGAEVMHLSDSVGDEIEQVVCDILF